MTEETERAAAGGIGLTDTPAAEPAPEDKPAEPAPETAAVATAEPPKKKIQRKPVWVCVPLEPEDPLSSSYEVTRCENVKAIRAVLARHEIDVRNIENVLMFRANPIEFKIDMQYKIRFSG